MSRTSKTEGEANCKQKRYLKFSNQKGDKRASEGGSESGQKNFLPLFDRIQGSE